ncbi:MAG: hypothetical protein IJB21_01420 [Bacilli bacterium]|nr:hypothetical protein [Bacilli bacterium]
MAKKEIKGFNIKCLNEAGTVVLAYDAVGYYYGNKYISIDLKQTSIIDSISSKMKILNATLELTAKKWNLGPSFEGMDVYINDELIDIVVNPGKNGKVLVNITNEIMKLISSGSSKNVLKIIPRNTLSNGYVIFYTDQDNEEYEPKIIVDYIPKQLFNAQAPFQEFDCMEAGIGKVNLSTGELYFEHTDMDSGSVFLPFPLKHIYNSNRCNERGEVIIDVKKINDFNTGDGWKLNLQQYLFRNEKATIESGYDVYNYLDGDGNIHEFVEFYYYVFNDERKYVTKEQVVINLDGSLSYDGNEIIKELRSTNGLILITDYSTYNNENLIELRSEEISSLEDQLEELNNYVDNLQYNNKILNQNKDLMNIYKEIKNLEFAIEEISQNANVKDVIVKEQLFNKQESLKSLKRIFEEKFAEYYDDGTNEYSTYFKAKEEYLKNIIELINELDSKYNTMITKRNNAYNNMDDEGDFQNAQKQYTFASNAYQDASREIELEQRRFSDIEQNATISYQKETEKINNEMEDISNIANKEINELLEEKNNLNSELIDLNKNYSYLSEKIQLEQLDNEIEKNNKEIAKYKKQIIKLNNALIKLYESTETNFILNSNNILLGFNKYGNLISISDFNSNKIVISYKDGNIHKLIENEEKELVFIYEDNLLVEIKNFNNQYVKFKYLNNKLVQIMNEDGESSIFDYDENGALNNIRNSFGYGYKIDYDLNKIIKLSEYTTAELISNQKIEFLDDELYGQILNIDYIDLHTITISNNNNIKRTYLIDVFGNLKSAFEIINNKTFSISNEYITNKSRLLTSPKKSAINLIEEVNWIGLERPYSDGYGLLGGAPFSERYVYANVNIDKVKNKKNLILSAYVTANSAFMQSSIINDYIGLGNYYNNYSCENKQNRKFECRIETTYNSGRVNIIKYSLDCMNKQKQYISFPVSFEEKKNINKITIPNTLPYCVFSDEEIIDIKIIFDYSYNINYLIFEDVRLEEGEWSYTEFNQNNQKIYEASSSIEGNKYYKYNKDNLLVEEKHVKDGIEEFIIYKYDANNQLLRTENNFGEIIENLYKNKKCVGNVSYNICNPTQKYYEEYEYYENGLIKNKYDERGIVECEFEYLNDSSGLVKSIKYANGSKVINGYNYKNDNLVAITQSSNGLNNLNELHYTKGLLTQAISNKTLINYEYDGFARLKKVFINNVLYIEKDYSNNNLCETTRYINGEGYKIIYDIYGKVIATKYLDVNNGEHEYLQNEYDERSKLVKLLEIENDVCYNIKEYSYDEFDNIISEVINYYGENISIENRYNDTNNLINTGIIYDNFEQNYEFCYDTNYKNLLQKITLPNGVIQSIDYDNFDRIIKIDYNNCITKEFNYLQVGDHATSLISNIILKRNNDIISKQIYVYDSMNNISEIRENGHIILRYQYDEINRIIREDNKELNFTKIFEYDCNGNISSITEYEFILGVITVEPIKVDYNHYDYNWSDQISLHNSERFEYDSLGNPYIYRNKNLEFSHGKQLKKFDEIEYTYNTKGVRTSKKLNNQIIRFYLSDNKILSQKNLTNNDSIYFNYGAEGVNGFNYNGVEYLYLKTLQNDVSFITDLNGNIVAKYIYDAWGNHKVFNALNVEVNDPNFIGNINPFRYRSYYFDVETNLYYCNNRYYDPELCRWLNADNIDYLEFSTINGMNLYSYCLNNPVMFYDESGCSPKWWQWLISGVSIAAGVVFCIIPGTQVLGVSLLVSGGSSLIANILDATGVDGKTANIIISALDIIAGTILCFTPFAAVGAGMIGSGIGGIAGGYISEALGYSFELGSIIGSVVGGIIGGKIHEKINQLRTTVVVDGKRVPVYRGGNDLKLSDADIKNYNKFNSKRGVSLNSDPTDKFVMKYGGPYKLKSMPFGLKLTHTGNTHYEIIPIFKMSIKAYEKLLKYVKLIGG